MELHTVRRLRSVAEWLKVSSRNKEERLLCLASSGSRVILDHSSERYANVLDWLSPLGRGRAFCVSETPLSLMGNFSVGSVWFCILDLSCRTLLLCIFLTGCFLVVYISFVFASVLLLVTDRIFSPLHGGARTVSRLLAILLYIFPISFYNEKM